MPKKYVTDGKRYVVVKKDEVCILEDGSNKRATFNYSRWAWFTEHFEEIDNAVSKLIKGEEDVKLFVHLGGAWHVSVTSGVRCVDVRRFYMTRDGSTKPTRTGFAIRLREWDRMKQIAGEMKTHHPKIAEAQPCWTQSDHFNQEGALMCCECNPFGNWFTNTSST